jgi:hypothetical protein
MAMPSLYWMLECTGCRARRVVFDCYLVPGAGREPEDMFGNYGGPPLEERYECLNACAERMRTVGSIWAAGDETMWQHTPYAQIQLDRSQIDEWSRLIGKAGLTRSQST